MRTHINYFRPPKPTPTSKEVIFALDPALWVLEMKKNGNRVIVFKQSDQSLEIWSRYGRRYPLTHGADRIEKMMQKLPPGSVVEGEWVVQEGIYYLFDVIYLEGCDLSQEELDFRRVELERLVGVLNFPNLIVIPRSGASFSESYEEWKSQGNIEGVITKRKDSIYQLSWTDDGVLSPFWYKRRFAWDQGKVM